MQALKVLNDDMQCDVIKIGGLIRNKVRQLMAAAHAVTYRVLSCLAGGV